MSNKSEILSVLIFNVTQSISKNRTLSNLVKNAEKIFVHDDQKIRDHSILEPIGGNYYFGGVFFMISVLGLLMYVNFYYENCFSQTLIDISKLKCCCCIRHILEKNNSKLNRSRNQKSSKRQQCISYSTTLHKNEKT